MPAKGPLSLAAPCWTPSLASQLLQGQACRVELRRSRLAGEGAFEPCSALMDAFAGKPAPTRPGLPCGTS
ncbi:hypothetical protein C5U62_23315 [Pseudomonas protegens]|uniref:Uncharacterized protein n=1 Tax=Pseudomonas protegens TaxID=380021 RepID=A0A2T6GHC7_9PSED|nr:hypothetical protein C5U62_23315 [Pseudomonas protegens]